MIDLLPVLVTATATLQRQMEQWFSGYPAGMPWTVVSDYCIGDENKNNDVFSLVVIANHTTAKDLCEYLANVAPNDLKNTNNVPLGLVQYLTCEYPVTFSVSFVLRRSEALLRAYIRTDNMAAFIPDACEMLVSWRDHSSVGPQYFEQAIRRLRLFGKDLARKQVNEKLARQIHLTAAAVAVTFHVVNKSTKAGYLRWISDRDALIERYDTVVYDLAFYYWLLLEARYSGQEPDAEGKLMLKVPEVQFETPEPTGKHRFDEMVRLPDYLAGTLADLEFDTMSFSREKFSTVLHNVFVNNQNNWIVQLLSDSEKVTARSALFRA